LLEIGHWMFHSPIGTAIANGPKPATAFSTVELSKQLFRPYLFPFEATSILILIAILGALVLARKEE
jgi:NADH-quinone oxidoreductase subunit J